jgi:hypothetical protein
VEWEGGTNVVESADVVAALEENKLVVVVPTLPLTKVVVARLAVDRLVLDVEFTMFTKLMVVLVELRGNIFPSTISCRTWVLIVAAITTPFPFVVWFTGLSAIPNIVWHPNAGTGPKLVAKRLAINVNRLFEAPGAGEVASVNNASFKAMKSPDAAYLMQ